MPIHLLSNRVIFTHVPTGSVMRLVIRHLGSESGSANLSFMSGRNSPSSDAINKHTITQVAVFCCQCCFAANVAA